MYAFAREELDSWERRLGVELANGSFGENLTTLGLDVDASLVGDRWAVGDEVVLEVTGPRIPCATFAARMGIRGWLKTFSRGRPHAAPTSRSWPAARCGRATRSAWSSRPEHDVDVPTTFRAFMGDLEAAEHVLAVGCLPEHELAALRDMVERAGRKALDPLPRRAYREQVVKSTFSSSEHLMHERSLLGPADVDDATLTSMVA